MPRVTITVPDKNSQPYRFQLDREVVSLGRGSENDIAIDSGSVSVKHAEMRRIRGGYELHDVGSTNGIKLDGLRMEMIPLRSGASVKIGDVAFDFILSEEEIDALAQEKPTGSSPITRESELPPAPKPPPRPSYAPAPSGGSSFGATFVFVLLAVIAFYAGLEIRHQKETGKPLYQAIQAKKAAQAAPAKPAGTP
jgi:pSer/pThr/pTyr-binding forkhead associated (FHA) protein